MNYQKVHNKLEITLKEQAERDNIRVKMSMMDSLAAGEHVKLYMKIASSVGSTSFELSYAESFKIIRMAEFLSKLGLIEYMQSGDDRFEMLATRKGLDLYNSAIEQVNLEETIEMQPFESDYVSF